MVVTIPFSSCTSRLESDYQYYVVNSSMRECLTEEQYASVVEVFPGTLICSLTVTAAAFWSAACVWGVGVVVLHSDTQAGILMFAIGSVVMLCALAWSQCNKRRDMKQACKQLAVRHPNLTFKIEPYTVGAVSGITRQYCLRIAQRDTPAIVDEGYEAPLIP